MTGQLGDVGRSKAPRGAGERLGLRPPEPLEPDPKINIGYRANSLSANPYPWGL